MHSRGVQSPWTLLGAPDSPISCGSGALCLSVFKSFPSIQVGEQSSPLLQQFLFSFKPPSGSCEVNLANQYLSDSKDNIRPGITAPLSKQFSFKQCWVILQLQPTPIPFFFLLPFYPVSWEVSCALLLECYGFLLFEHAYENVRNY